MVKRKQVEGLPEGWFFEYDTSTKTRHAVDGAGTKIPVKAVQEIRKGLYSLGEYLSSYNESEGKYLPKAYKNKYKEVVQKDTYYNFQGKGWHSTEVSSLELAHEYIASRLLLFNTSHICFIKAYGVTRGISSTPGEVKWLSLTQFSRPSMALADGSLEEAKVQEDRLFEDVYYYAVDWI